MKKNRYKNSLLYLLIAWSLPSHASDYNILIERDTLYDTLSCNIGAVNSWLNSIQLDLIFNDTLTACDTNGLRVSHDLPLDDTNIGNCDTKSFNIFIEDACGVKDTLPIQLTTIDDEPPVLFGIPTTNLFLSCSDPIPQLPIVTASDNCLDSATINSNITLDSTFRLFGSCYYEYSVEYRWTVSDGCNPPVSGSFFINVQDFDANDPFFGAPTFTAPDDIVINCTDDPNDLSLTGQPTDIIDNCDVDIANRDPLFSDEILEGDCPGNYTIQRTWTVEDTCGTTSLPAIQIITIVDSIPPTFTAPNDTAFDRCDSLINIDLLGQPTNIIDNCTPSDQISVYVTSIDTISGYCPGTYTLAKNWTVEDACGNLANHQQLINFADNTPPEFIKFPKDTVITCFYSENIDSIFNQWVREYGGAIADDNCSASEDLNWKAFVGNDLTPFIPSIECRVGSAIRMQIVSFSVTDECGNTSVAKASFSLVDTNPPIISNCPSDTILNLENDACSILLGWPTPKIEDTCPNEIIKNVLSQELPVLSADPATDSSSFGSVSTLSFSLPSPDKEIIYHPLQPIILTINLLNVNVEDPKEYFSVFDEDNQLIGITNHTPSPTMEPCQNSLTTFEIPFETYQNWIEDDSIRFQLVPNPQSDGIPGSDIDPICYGSSTANLQLSFSTVEYTGLSLFYQLDNNNPVQILDVFSDSFFLEIFPGNHQINLITIDCAGNADTCSTNVIVEDLQKASLLCPNTITIDVDIDSCSASLNPPLADIIDNCIPDQDTLSYFSGYELSGATETEFKTGIPSEPITFHLGTTAITYFIEDASGYKDSCSFDISIQDSQNPQALCKDDTIIINPGFDLNYALATEDIDAGSFDNCSLANLYIDNPEISCSDYPIKTLYLIAEDQAGNTDSCDFTLTVQKAQPQVDFTIANCASGELSLLPGPPEGNFSFLWSGPNGFTSSSAFPTIIGVDESYEGFYNLTLVGFENCSTSDSIFISAEDLPYQPILSNVGTSCQGDIISLTIDGDLPTGDSIQYLWYEDNILIASTDSSFFQYEVPTLGSDPELAVSVSKKGCTGPKSAPRRLYINESPNVVITATETKFCFGELLQLQASNPSDGYEYSWEGPDNFTAIGSTISLESMESGFFYLNATNGICNHKTDSVFIEVAPALPLPNIMSVDSLCLGDSLILQTEPLGIVSSYFWSGPNNQSFETETNKLIFDNVPDSLEGLWSVIQIIEGCATEASPNRNITVQPLPSADLSWQDTTICPGNSLDFDFNSSVQNPIISWNGPQGFNSTEYSFSINSIQPEQAGVYSFEIEDNFGCAAETSLNVEVSEAPVIDEIIVELPDCFGSGQQGTLYATISSTTTPLAYQWIDPNNDTISNSSSLVIDGISSQDNGIYTLVITNVTGCQSKEIVDLQVPNSLEKPAIPEGISSLLCEGDELLLSIADTEDPTISFQWTTPLGILETTEPFLSIENATVNNSGEYAVQFKKDGCLSEQSNIITVEVISIPVLQADIQDVACEGQPFQLNAIGPDGTEFNWQGPNFSANIANPMVNNGTSGTYILNGSLGSCIAVPDTLQINLNPVPETPLIESSGPVCLSNSSGYLKLSIDSQFVSDSALYEWFQMDNLLARTDSNDFIIEDFAGYQSGIYEFSVRANQNGCISDFSNTLNITFTEAPENRAFAGIDKEICSSSILTLDASAPDVGTGKWSIVNGPTDSIVIVNPNHPKSDVTNLVPDTIYTFRWTLSDGVCQNYDYDDVLIKVTLQSLVEAGEDILACAANSTQLNATEVTNGIGSWVQNPLQELIGVRIVTPSDPNTVITGLEPGNQYKFTWVVASACGSSTDEVFVVVSDPNPNAGDDMTVCSDENTVELTAAEPTIGSAGQWIALDSTIIFSNPENHLSNATGLKNGLNTFVWIIDQGVCGPSSKDTLLVDFTPSPIATNDEYDIPFQQEASLDILINDSTFNETIQLNIVQNPVGGDLVIEDDSIIRYLPNALFVGEDKIIYEICVENCACAMADVLLNVGTDAPCTVPTIFTPNGDGINDQLIITCLLDDTGYPDSQLTIYNSWGDEVYRSGIPYQNDWEGTYKGNDLPVGTYYYILNFGTGGTPVAGFIVIQR